MIIKRSEEILGVLISKDKEAEQIYREACNFDNTEEFGKEVYKYNLKRRACDLDMGSGINNPQAILDGFARLDEISPYDNEIIDKDVLLQAVHLLLDKAEIPVDVQSDIINGMLDSTNYDMNLKMDIMEQVVRFFMYERGKLIYEKRIENAENIIYIILENVISTYCNMQAFESDDFLGEKWIKKAEADAFTKIGEPHISMYNSGISIYDI